MKHYKPDSKTCVTEYASLSEFLNHINSLPNNRYIKIKPSQETYSSDNNWSGTASYERATELITNGWDAQAKKLTTNIKAVSGAHQTVQYSKPTYGVIGSQASVPRYLQGIPTNMISRQATPSKQKIITITKGISYHSGFSSKQILDESTKALQIIQALEKGGQRVRLNVMIAVTEDGRSTICKVCVKKPDERLNISKMAFPLSHPSMLRRFFFKWFETDPFIDFDVTESFGTPARSSVIELAMADNEYFIPEVIPDVNKVIESLKAPKPRKSSV